MTRAAYTVHTFGRLAVVCSADGVPVDQLIALIELFRVICRHDDPLLVYGSQTIAAARAATGAAVVLVAAPPGYTDDQINRELQS